MEQSLLVLRDFPSPSPPWFCRSMLYDKFCRLDEPQLYRMSVGDCDFWLNLPYNLAEYILAAHQSF